MRLYEFISEDSIDAEENLYAPYSDTAEVRAVAYPHLEEKIEQLNRKATKLGVTPITLSKEGELYKDVKTGERDANGDPLTRKELFYKVRVSGSPPRLEGYRFLATIEHGEHGNIIKTVPGQSDNPKLKDFYEARPDYCDHCRTRRRRIDTFIVSDEDGNLRQIGRNCLSDFLGGIDPKAVLFYFNLRDSIQDAIDEAEERGGRDSYGVRQASGSDKKTVLMYAAAAIRNWGYHKKPEEFSGGPLGTGQRVWWALYGDKRNMEPSEREELLKIVTPTPEDEKLVADALAWLDSLPQQEKDNNNFMHNLDVIMKGDVITSKNTGMAVALFPAYFRAMQSKKERQAAPEKSNEWVGTPGGKITNVKVTVTGTRLIDSQYGTTQLVSMEDESGNALKWFNSGSNRDFKEGQEFTIRTATVKGHEDYKGRKQTMLKLVKT